jgi:hypothetical protein
MVGAVVEQTAMTTAMRDAKRLRDGGERLCCNDQLLNASSFPAVEASVAIAIAAQLSLMVGLLQVGALYSQNLTFGREKNGGLDLKGK